MYSFYLVATECTYKYTCAQLLICIVMAIENCAIVNSYKCLKLFIGFALLHILTASQIPECVQVD